MSKHYYGEDDLDFLSPPSLGEALWGNKIKSILLLGGVYIAGAVIGKRRSIQGATFAGRKLGETAAWSARKIGQTATKMQNKAGSTAQYQGQQYLTSHQLEKK